MAIASMPSALHGFQCLANGHKIRLGLGRAICEHTLVDFMNLLVEQFWFDDFLGENVRTRLIAERQSVAETPGDEQGSRIALALQQGVGGNGGAHFDGTNLVGRDFSLLIDVQ